MQFSTLSRVCRQALCTVLAASAVVLWPFGHARAELIDTPAVLASSPEMARADLQALLARPDLRAELARHGVDPAEAEARIASLSDAEVVRLQQQIDQVPAGGDFVGVIVAILLITLLVLLITDLLGYTDVFSFINPLPRGNVSSSGGE
jgi:hypothetical protein